MGVEFDHETLRVDVYLVPATSKRGSLDYKELFWSLRTEKRKDLSILRKP